jgi:eukaryotic-like serine/threonine-protein kinase
VTIGPGTRIGVYEVSALIGEGGMGQVYRASDTRLKRQVAIKILSPAFAADRDRLARFTREAEVLASLNHPHIAAIYGLEESAEGTALVMELVEGEDLSQRIARGAMPLDEALPIANQIAIALEAAHEQGIVHRDLKPANIKVRPDGTVKVLDFGLAKAMEPATGNRQTADGIQNSPTITSPAMTRAGMILGTAAYMSPEQARGRVVDKRADIWAFGAVLYEMLTGRRAFAGDDVADVLGSVMAREPDWTRLPTGLSPTAIAHLKRCLEKDPKRRVRDIGDVALALTGAFDVNAHDQRAPAAIAAPLWKRALPIGLAALLAALVTGAVDWSRWPSPEPPRPATRFDYVLPEGQQLPTTQRPTIAVSPDGRSFIYQEQSGLFLRSMGELEARRLAITQEPRLSPFFSPDGQWLAYYTTGALERTGQLKKVPVSGGASITVCEITSFPNGQSWADGNTILFGQAAGIMRVSANGGSPELLIPVTDGEQMYGPELLPGGNAVLFSVTKDQGPARWNQAQVVVQSLATGQRSVVAPRGYDARFLATGHLLYALDDDVYAVAFDANRLTTSGNAVPVVQNVQRPVGLVAAALNLVVSNEGTLVYLAAQSSLRSLVWVDRHGGSEPITAIPAGDYSDVRLSPAGGRVLLTREGDIWVYDLASGRSSRLTRDGASQMGVWNPTGSRIAYSSARGGNLEAWVQSADGDEQPRQLTTLGGQVHVDSWSPDGRILSIHHHRASGAGTAILMLPIDQADAKPQPFLSADLNKEGARFSRDGRHVVFLSIESGQREIYIRQYPGPGGQATVSVGGGMEAMWSARGDEVFYRSLNGDRMFAAPVTTVPTFKVGTPVQLFQRRYYVAPSGSPRPQYDVSADGQRFLMLAPTTGTDAALARPRIVVVQNWFEELKRLVPGAR